MTGFLLPLSVVEVIEAIYHVRLSVCLFGDVVHVRCDINMLILDDKPNLYYTCIGLIAQNSINMDFPGAKQETNYRSVFSAICMSACVSYLLSLL